MVTQTARERIPVSLTILRGAVFLALFFWCSLPAPSRAGVTPGAPSGQTATITGTVQSVDGKFIAGAVVRLIGPSVGRATTNAAGIFMFTDVSFGKYAIEVEATGFAPAVNDNIVINSDT